MNVGDWVAEITTTVGTGDIALGGAISEAYCQFSDAGLVLPWYVIIDGDNRETGQGTINGNTLERTTVHATLVNGVYSDNSPGPITLSGAATVHSVFNATAFDLFETDSAKLAGIEANATADQIASEVPFTPTGNIASTNVQSAIAEVALESVNVDYDASYPWTGIHAFANDVSFTNPLVTFNSTDVVFNGNVDFSSATVTGLPEGGGSGGYTPETIINKTASYTLTLADAGVTIVMDNAFGTIVTIPGNGTVAFDIGTKITVVNIGAGDVSIFEEAEIPGAATVLVESPEKRSALQYGSVSAIKIATNTWVVLNGTQDPNSIG